MRRCLSGRIHLIGEGGGRIGRTDGLGRCLVTRTRLTSCASRRDLKADDDHAGKRVREWMDGERESEVVARWFQESAFWI
jgi:hypothetical protein